MKKIFTLFMAFAILCANIVSSAATFPTKPPVETPTLNAKDIMLPIGKTGNSISLRDLAYISIKDFEKLTNKNLKVWDEIGFKMGQKQLRNKMNADGTIKHDVAKKMVKKMADGETGFHLGGFALGFLVGLIGVLIAYLIDDEKKSNRVKWAWLGLGAAVLLYLLLVVAIIA
ncbi:MAG TPA: hypothetical protein VF609_12185 [Flavisolibacter sp.]|jgi:hypothetical protein